MFSRRASASRAELAWTVDIEPSWPVFIACIMSNASRAADLADDDAVGPHAKRVAHEVALADRALAFEICGRDFELHDMLLLQLAVRRCPRS